MEDFSWTDEELFDLIDKYLNEDAAETGERDEDDDFDLSVPCISGCNGWRAHEEHTPECDDAYWLYVKTLGKSGDAKVSLGSDSFGHGSSWSKWSKCDRHYMDEFVLSDGTIVHGSTHHHRGIDEIEPDLACYLDSIWTPATIAFVIGWRDFGLPGMSMEKVRVVAEELLASARNGQKVEVGCIGGHGRTGTMLALIDCLAMERADGDLAIERVRSIYCKHAIETREQEWYVRAFAATINGDPIPAKPEPPKPVVTKVASGKPAVKPKAKAKDNPKSKANKKRSKKGRYNNRKR